MTVAKATPTPAAEHALGEPRPAASPRTCTGVPGRRRATPSRRQPSRTRTRRSRRPWQTRAPWSNLVRRIWRPPPSSLPRPPCWKQSTSGRAEPHQDVYMRRRFRMTSSNWPRTGSELSGPAVPACEPSPTGRKPNLPQPPRGQPAPSRTAYRPTPSTTNMRRPRADALVADRQAIGMWRQGTSDGHGEGQPRVEGEVTR